jgi:SET domain
LQTHPQLLLLTLLHAVLSIALITHSIHGWGAFAGEEIAAGEFVAEYKGEIINEEEFNKRGKQASSNTCTIIYQLFFFPF